MKKRFGENERGSEQEESLWFKAYNMLTPEKEGISLMDFKMGEDVLEKVMGCMSMK